MDTSQPVVIDGKTLSKKTLQAITMCQAGIDPREALKYVNLKDNISPKAVSNLRQKVKKYSLLDDSVVKAAQTQVKRILKGKAREEAHSKVNKAGEVVQYTEKVYPTDSNILAAASMVYDRYEPIQGSEGDAGQGNTYIDLSQYQVQINVDNGQS